MSTPDPLEGWTPEPHGVEDLASVVDRAFDYRGDVTVVLADGTERVGYVFNRNRDVAQPFLEMFDAATSARVTLLCAHLRTIKFTGKDMAAGKSYAAWLERKKAARSETTPASDA
jgi:hypothetical protein